MTNAKAIVVEIIDKIDDKIQSIKMDMNEKYRDEISFSDQIFALEQTLEIVEEVAKSHGIELTP